MNILIIDDEEEILDTLVEILEPTGYRCTTFTNPNHAMERFKEEDFDVVITDIKMPKMSGMELLKSIRSIDNKVRVIIVTGHETIDAAVDAVNYHAYSFLKKPLNINEFIPLLEKISYEVKNHSDFGWNRVVF